MYGTTEMRVEADSGDNVRKLSVCRVELRGRLLRQLSA